MNARIVIAAAALVLTPTALAAYPTPFAAQGGPGVLNNDGTLSFVAYETGSTTTLATLKLSDGTRLRTTRIPGAFGIPSSVNRTPEGNGSA